MGTLSGREIDEAGLSDWAFLRDGLQTRLQLPDYATGLRLVAAIGAVAEQTDHHPDLDLRHRTLDVRLTSHDARGVTGRDLRLARTISALAAQEGVAASPRGVERLELGLDTPDLEALLPFWSAVLDVPVVRSEDGSPDLRDGFLPDLWFQPSGSEEPRQRFHLDLWVAPEVVQERIDAAVAAGGTLVSDAEAPAFWVLADREGNKVCLCTWQDRSAG